MTGHASYRNLCLYHDWSCIIQKWRELHQVLIKERLGNAVHSEECDKYLSGSGIAQPLATTNNQQDFWYLHNVVLHVIWLNAYNQWLKCDQWSALDLMRCDPWSDSLHPLNVLWSMIWLRSDEDRSMIWLTATSERNLLDTEVQWWPGRLQLRFVMTREAFFKSKKYIFLDIKLKKIDEVNKIVSGWPNRYFVLKKLHWMYPGQLLWVLTPAHRFS